MNSSYHAYEWVMSHVETWLTRTCIASVKIGVRHGPFRWGTWHIHCTMWLAHTWRASVRTCTVDMSKWFEGSSVCVCVCVREGDRESLCVHWWHVQMVRGLVCVCMRMCVWQRKRECVVHCWHVQMVWGLARVCMCVCVCVKHCNILQNTATYGTTPDISRFRHNTSQHSATHLKCTNHAAKVQKHSWEAQHAATHCRTLHHTTTHLE